MGRDELREQLSRSGEEYWRWDQCRWGTHRVNCLPGSCPFRVYARDGKVLREEISCTYPDFTDAHFQVPDFNPRGCQKGACYSHRMYDASRLKYPLKRAGERGEGKWKRISWDEALTEIADKTIDATGKYVLPGCVDPHTHLDMPFGGTVTIDDVESGQTSAAFGGTTQLVITWLIHVTGNPIAPAWYLTGAAMIALIALMLLPESAPVRLGGSAAPQSA